VNRCYFNSDVKVGGSIVTEFVEVEQPEWEGKWHRDVIYYKAMNSCRTLSDRKVKTALNLAMSTWDLEIPIKFKSIGGKFPLTYPDIRISFSSDDHYFKEKSSVLAYAYFPEQGSKSGEIIFNDNYIWSTNGKPISVRRAKRNGWITDGDDNNTLKTYNIIHVLIHELGHSLGLKHDSHDDSNDVMDAYYSGKLELSDWDLIRIRAKYGIRIWKWWSRYAQVKRIFARLKANL
tara:strand:- start:1025 stop:1723 length:699 start_codon:yes stop_codon:yes gene_type:complete